MVPYTGLDRSKIPATQDSLIFEPAGLEGTLYGSRKLGPDNTQRLPTVAVGENPGEAFMSTGRAYAMFGSPEDPGEDPVTEEDAVTELSSDMRQTSISPPAATGEWAEEPPKETAEEAVEGAAEESPAPLKPRTELEFRSQGPRTVTDLSQDAQWAHFGPRRYLKATAPLVAHYVRAARMLRLKPANDKRAGEATSAGTADEKTGYEAWSAPGELDFPGLALWINALQETDGKFAGSTIPKMVDDREKRKNDLTAALQAKAPLALKRFDDSTLGDRNPPVPANYNPALPLLQKDLGALGIRTMEK